MRNHLSFAYDFAKLESNVLTAAFRLKYLGTFWSKRTRRKNRLKLGEVKPIKS